MEFDATLSFMTPDHDGKIRMDCSGPYAMARLVGLKDRPAWATGAGAGKTLVSSSLIDRVVRKLGRRLGEERGHP
jgi:phosphoglucomutase